jgi:hypothetical protein
MKLAFLNILCFLLILFEDFFVGMSFVFLFDAVGGGALRILPRRATPRRDLSLIL